ncbi:DUF4123 domain-containing protein [Acinetobacter sp. 194]|uniref:DUF4123 domain-containing protein n=1 Tax=Acinetobacter shaoyimingii TaxID=2715164 RepID=UPI0014075E52|nr:DUF4123 domain-containing protein [Acinetobacter shaoyimingii]NHB58775.1 DUF4123 domain-containing protein [Acinetobacter shaoyimingii]
MKTTTIPFMSLDKSIEIFKDDNFVYLILDAAQFSDQSLDFINTCRSDSRVEIYSLFAGTTEGNAPFEVAPLLIVVHDLNMLKNDNILFIHQIWCKDQALNIVFSKLELSLFVKKMKQYLTVKFPDNTQKLFRWFDPRVLKKINKILDEDQEAEFFNGIERWVISVRNYQDVNSNMIMIMEST